MTKVIPIFLNALAIVVCSLIGIACLKEGLFHSAGFQFFLVILNTITLIWVVQHKPTDV